MKWQEMTLAKTDWAEGLDHWGGFAKKFRCCVEPKRPWDVLDR